MMKRLLRRFAYVQELESEIALLRFENATLAQSKANIIEGKPLPTAKLSTKEDKETQGAWICYQLRLIGLTQGHIAEELGVTQQMVQRVAYGLVTSARVQKGIAIALGYKTWSELSEAREGVAA